MSHLTAALQPEPSLLGASTTIPSSTFPGTGKTVIKGPSKVTAFLLNGDLTKEEVLHEDERSSLAILSVYRNNVNKGSGFMFHAYFKSARNGHSPTN
jgi:S1-C subfamily serine protease